jgi:hypothetical protein
VLTALALALLGFGFVMVYAGLTGQSVGEQFAQALGR